MLPNAGSNRWRDLISRVEGSRSGISANAGETAIIVGKRAAQDLRVKI